MKNYFNVDKLKDLLSDLKEEHKHRREEFDEGVVFAVNEIEEDIEEIIDSLQQEQSDIDLEEEVKKYFQGYWPGTKALEACNHHMVFTAPAIMRMIKHFFELGLNARREN